MARNDWTPEGPDGGYEPTRAHNISWGTRTPPDGTKTISTRRPDPPTMAMPAARPGSHYRTPPPDEKRGPWPVLVLAATIAVIVAAAVLLAISLRSNGNTNTGNGAPAGNSTSNSTTGTTAPASASTSTSASSSTSSSSTSSTSTTSTTVAGAQNLGVTDAIKTDLVASWIAANPGSAGIGSADVAGTTPNSVYYGKEADGTYWALAQFSPSASLSKDSSTAAGQTKLAQFGKTAIFSWKSGPTWTYQGEIAPSTCPSAVPAAMLTAWKLCQ